MVCPHCQAVAPDDASFCPKCGAALLAASRIILPPGYQAPTAPPVKPAAKPKPAPPSPPKVQAPLPSSKLPAKHLPTWVVLLVFGSIAAYFFWPDTGGGAAAPPPAISEKTREELWVLKGQEAVVAKLKDGKSAEFRGVFFHKGPDGTPLTCGEVNAKNSFGGYTGFTRFISGGSSSNTFIEDEVEDFRTAWQRFCVAT